MAKLHTYALIKALFDQNKDYFDALSPLIMGVLSGTSFQDLTVIQKSLKTKHQIEIPLHILKTTCARAKSNGYIEQEFNTRRYRINKSGEKYLTELEPVDEVERRTNSFLSTASTFFNAKGRNLDREKIRSLVESFIQENLDGLVDFINPKTSSVDRSGMITKQDSSMLVDFIKEIQDSKPAEYNQFKELVFGSILSSLLSVNNSSDIAEAESKNLKKSSIFFDSNVIFSLLELHSNEKNTAAKELFDLLKNLGFKLKVFDFTVDEVCRVMNGYILNKHRFPKDIPVDHVYSVFREKGWGASDISEFIVNVEEKIEDLGIEIVQTDVILTEYKSPNNEALRPRIAAIKTMDNRGLSTTHDLAAVDKIRQLRKRTVRKIEDAEAFFLTADFSLQKTILFSLGHNESGTLSEVVLDRVLANILWLKNPKLNLPLNTIIATHSRDLLIDRRIWEKFYTLLGKLKNDGTISEEKIDNLFYHRNIANILKEFDKGDIDKINKELVMEVVEEATASLSEKEKEEAKKLAEVQGRLFEVENENEVKEQEYNTKLIAIRKSLHTKAHKHSSIFVTIASIIIVIILIPLEVYIFQWLLQNLPQKWVDLIYYPYSGIGVVLLTGTLYLVKKIREHYIKHFERIIYKKLLKQIDLTE